MTEVWKPIKGYEELYEASALGRVRSLDRVSKSTLGNPYIRKGKVLKANINGKNRVVYRLFKDGKGKSINGHRLIAETFIPKVSGKPQVNHIDGNPTNNEISNLEWCTNQENIQHAFDNGLATNEGESNPRAILNEEEVLEVRDRFSRGESLDVLIEDFGLTHSGITSIIKRRTWKHV